MFTIFPHNFFPTNTNNKIDAEKAKKKKISNKPKKKVKAEKNAESVISCNVNSVFNCQLTVFLLINKKNVKLEVL